MRPGWTFWASRRLLGQESLVGQSLAAYREVQASPGALIDRLGNYRNDEKEFYAVRASVPATDAERAARFIYLNKTAFNGLWRVNSKGQHNAPFGRYANPNICDQERIWACHSALRNTTIEEASFDALRVESGDFVYCDPPYVPVSATAAFTSYAKSAFGPAQQTALHDASQFWRASGATVVLSNADVPEVRALYSAERFDLHAVEMARSINCVAGKRGKVGELLIVAKRRALRLATESSKKLT